MTLPRYEQNRIHVRGALTKTGRVYYDCPVCHEQHLHGYVGRTKSTHCWKDPRQVCIHVQGEKPDCSGKDKK